MRELIGMLHVDALPGTPRYSGNLAGAIERAVAEAKVYQQAGFTSLAVENMHDRPYLKAQVGPEIVASLTTICCGVKAAVDMPVGLQVLAGANREALAVALAADLQFVRVEGFVFAHVADEGWIDGCAGDLLRYRKQIGAEHVKVYVDIKKKHSAHAVTADVDIAESARAAEFFLADGVIVTGASTGYSASSEQLADVKKAVQIPVFIGSGITADNLSDYAHADGVIVGSAVKEGGQWDQPLSLAAAQQVGAAFNSLAVSS